MLNPGAFRWGVADSETTSGAQVTRLEYANGRFPAYFQFDRYLHQHYALYSWGHGEEVEEHFVGTWPHQVLHLVRWIARLEQQARTRERSFASTSPPSNGR